LYKQSNVVIPAKAGIQQFYWFFLDSCLRRSDSLFVPLLIQTPINNPACFFFGNRWMAKSACKFVIAAFLYLVFAVYLYLPFFGTFHKIQYLFVLTAPVASAGCFLLSRRWVASFPGSFFAGAIYGFGPFMLGLARFHPAASFLAASVPWFFLPAAFGPKGKWRMLRVFLSFLPFLVIILFFQVAVFFRLFAIPIQARVNITDLVSILSPLVAARFSLTLVGFYHVPLLVIFIGFTMLIKARRVWILLIIFAGIAGGFSNAVFGVSPIIWLTPSFVCFAVIAGAGIDGLALAGKADRRWILAACFIMLLAAVAALLLATKYFQTFAGLGSGYARLFLQSAKSYLLASAAAAVIFILARAQIRLTPLRLILLSCCLTLDILFSARFIVDSLFVNIS
jgi:hypothetical protein